MLLPANKCIVNDALLFTVLFLSKKSLPREKGWARDPLPRCWGTPPAPREAAQGRGASGVEGGGEDPPHSKNIRRDPGGSYPAVHPSNWSKESGVGVSCKTKRLQAEGLLFNCGERGNRSFPGAN